MHNPWQRGQNGHGVQWTDALFYLHLNKFFFLEDSQNDDSQVEDEKCEDTGCGRLWNGHGQCVNMTKMTYSHLSASYDMEADTDAIKNDRSLCKSPESDKECCRCFKKRPCMDEGCDSKGGMCVDMMRANLKDKNVFPLNSVNLDVKIQDINGTKLCKGAMGSEKCCECYRKLEATPTPTPFPTSTKGNIN